MRQNKIRKFFVTTLYLSGLSLVMISQSVHARELQGRMGLGYNNEFANSAAVNGTAGISVKYGLTRDIGAEAIVGIATNDPVNSVTAIKLFKNIFYETNLNFYFMLGGGILKANELTGAEFLGGFGAEFFIPGIESLGFAFETGGEIDNMTGSFAVKTLGVSFLNAGIHFYF